MKYCILFFSILIFNLKSIATTYYAGTCPGPITWNDWATSPFWTGLGATGTHLTSQPANGSILVIPAGCTVAINSNINSTNSYTFQVNGTLKFKTGNKLNMGSGSSISLSSTGNLDAGTGGGSANLITIGSSPGVDVWSSGIGDVSGPFILNATCSMTSAGPPTVYSPAGCGTALLPIELLEFTATCIANGVQLNWITATELNNDYFLIEKSNDGYDWEQIAKIKGLVNSYSVTKYIHNDYTTLNNLTYYRMSQVDLNGIKTVFKAIDVYCSDKDVTDQMILYPNPSSTELNIVLNVNNPSANTTITLVNNASQLIFEAKVDLIKGVNSFTFPAEIPIGSYTVFFSSSNIIIPAQKLMVIK